MSDAAPFASILPLNVQLPNDFFTQAVVIAKDVAARERLHFKLDKLLAQEFPKAIAFVSPLELGPPVGWPLQYRVSGPDVERVREIALKVGQIVAANPDAKQVNFDWMEPDRQVRIRVDQNEARLLGLSSQAIATVLNAVISGTPVTQVRDDIYLVNVVARATDEQSVSLDSLRNLQVPLPGGQTVPLSQFASFEYDQEFPLIWRRDRVPTLTVQAAIVGDKVAGGRSYFAVAGDREPQKNSSSLIRRGRGRDGGREPEIAGIRAGCGARDAVRHVHGPHGAATKLSETFHGPERGAARPDRCRRSIDAFRQAAWVLSPFSACSRFSA